MFLGFYALVGLELEAWSSRGGKPMARIWDSVVIVGAVAKEEPVGSFTL